MGQVNQPSNLLDRVIALERAVADLTKRTGLSSATIASGGVTIGSGGFLAANDPEGDQILYVGQSLPARPDGTLQPSVLLSDDAGNLRLSLLDDAPLVNGYHQPLRLFDLQGNVIFSDDADSGLGLHRPMLATPHAYHNRHSDWTLSSVSATVETVLTYQFYKQHPNIAFGFLADGSDGTTNGVVNVRVDNNNLAYTHTITSGITIGADLTFQPDGNIGDFSNFTIELQRTAGSGIIRFEPTYCYGAGSS